MIRNLLQLIFSLIKDLSSAYLFFLTYPFRILRGLFFRNNSSLQFKAYFIRWLLLPLYNISYYFSYYLIIYPIKKYYLSFIIPRIYNNNKFLYELNECDHKLVDNPKYIYKYLLFNKDNDHFKFPDPESNYDDFFNYLMYMKKIISPGWRQHHLFFYHEMQEYRELLYDNTIRVQLRKAAEVKVLDSFSVCLQNFILLYRFLVCNIAENSYDVLCFLRYRYQYFPSSVTYYHIRYLIQFIHFLNFRWLVNIPHKLVRSYMESLSLGEEGTERSIYYSKRFGFSGNLYLQFSYFLKDWSINLVKNSDVDSDRVYEDYRHTASWEYERQSLVGDNLKRLVHNRMYKQLYPFDLYDFDSQSDAKSSLETEREYMLRYRVQQSIYPRFKSTYRYRLEKHPSIYYIHRNVLTKFYYNLQLYKRLYSIFGNCTSYLVQLRSYLFLNPTHSESSSSILSTKLQWLYFRLDRYFLLVILFISLESIVFLSKTLYN